MLQYENLTKTLDKKFIVLFVQTHVVETYQPYYYIVIQIRNLWYMIFLMKWTVTAPLDHRSKERSRSNAERWDVGDNVENSSKSTKWLFDLLKNNFWLNVARISSKNRSTFQRFWQFYYEIVALLARFTRFLWIGRLHNPCCASMITEAYLQDV